MGKFGNELIESMTQAAAHARGRQTRGLRVTKVEVPDVKSIRRSLHMSQYRFAAAYRIPCIPTRPRRRICSPSSGDRRKLWRR
jgi:putative transcriptional regulator